jgi:hypothetical protein
VSQPTASVDIANLALDLLAQDPVVSIVNPSVVAADILARWYDQIRRLLLRKYIFNFARKVILLTPSANAPAHPEFVNGYALPVDLVRILKLGDRILYGGAIPTQLFDFSQGYLYCDNLTDQGVSAEISAPTLQITAIYRSGDTYLGTVVPVGSTVVAIASGTPIVGGQYQISSVLGATQANGNVYQIVPGLLGANAVYFLQTAGGQNFDSSAWAPYISGGYAASVYTPPGSLTNPTGLELSYTYDAKNVLQFDPAFIDVLAATLAVRTCKKITGKNPSQDLVSELRNAEVVAAAIAGQEKPPVRVQTSRIRNVRRAGGIYNNNTVIGGGY